MANFLTILKTQRNTRTCMLQLNGIKNQDHTNEKEEEKKKIEYARKKIDA